MNPNIGREVRLGRVVDRDSGKSLIVPLDHGVIMGPIRGIKDPVETVGKVADGGANAAMFQTGLGKVIVPEHGNRLGIIYTLTNSCTMRYNQLLLSTVRQAVRDGADAVAIRTWVGSDHERTALSNFQMAADECLRWGMPILAVNYFVEEKREARGGLKESIKHAARVAAEMGADMVKTVYTGSIDTFQEVVATCPVPVLMAGGPKTDDPRDLLQMVFDAMQAGAAGVAIGRNVWQARDPAATVRALGAIIHHGASVDQAMTYLRS
jgi:fructose-bisphosphate aldolase/2-amino-3,7-dideoxy-D-threo-hept-6-ulosonate synthase